MGWLVIKVLSMFPWWACSWGDLAVSISYHHLGFRSPLRVSVWVLCDSCGTLAKPPWVSLCCLSWNLLQALKGSAGGCWCCPWAVTESLTLTSCFQPLDSTSRHPTSKHLEVNLSHCFPSPSFLLHFSPSAQDPERRTGVPSSPPLTPVSSLQSLSVLLLTVLRSTPRSGLPPSLLALSVHLDRPRHPSSALYFFGTTESPLLVNTLVASCHLPGAPHCDLCCSPQLHSRWPSNTQCPVLSSHHHTPFPGTGRHSGPLGFECVILSAETTCPPFLTRFKSSVGVTSSTKLPLTPVSFYMCRLLFLKPRTYNKSFVEIPSFDVLLFIYTVSLFDHALPSISQVLAYFGVC